MNVDVNVDCETLRSACGETGTIGVRTRRTCGRDDERDPRHGATATEGYMSRRRHRRMRVSPRATCELVRAYKDAKLACGVVGKEA